MGLGETKIGCKLLEFTQAINEKTTHKIKINKSESLHTTKFGKNAFDFRNKKSLFEEKSNEEI